MLGEKLLENNYIYLPLSLRIYLNYFWSIEWSVLRVVHFNFDSASS